MSVLTRSKVITTHFDVIYQLLKSCDELVAAEVWALLELLPKNDTLVADFSNADSTIPWV
jgi:hypothetical protein